MAQSISPLHIRHGLLGSLGVVVASAGLAQGLLAAWLWSAARTGRVPADPELFLAALVFAGALGAFWWSRYVDGESSLSPRLAALLLGLQFAASAICLVAVPISFDPVKDGAGMSVWKFHGARILGYLLYVGPAAFFGGGLLPILGEMGLHLRRGLAGGLARLQSFRLLGLGAGLAVLAAPLSSSASAGAAALGSALAIGLTLWLGPRQFQRGDGEDDVAAARLWPARGLGLWRGGGYGLDQDLSARMTRGLWLAAILAGLAGGGALLLWSRDFAFVGYARPLNANLWPAGSLLGLALGAALTPPISRRGNPVGALALALVFMSLVFFIAPRHLYGLDLSLAPAELFAGLGVWLFFLALLPVGALWPLLAQIFQARRQWLASSLGLASLCLGLGAALAFLALATMRLSFQWTMSAVFIAALASSVLALACVIGRPPALLAALALGSFMFLSPPDWRSEPPGAAADGAEEAAAVESVDAPEEAAP